MGKKSKKKIDVKENKNENLLNSFVLVKVHIQNASEPFTNRFSSTDTVSDVKQHVLERSDCFFRTCVAFQNEKGSRLDDLTPLGNLCDESKNVTLRLIDKQYTLKDILIHFTRFYDTLSRGSFFTNFESKYRMPISLACVILGSEVENPQKNSEFKDFHTKNVDSLIYYYYNTNNNIYCNNALFKRLNLSFYNPPTGTYKLNGHLLYFEVLTVEDQFYGITCAVEGFFVNKSTQTEFNPDCNNYEQKFNTIENALCFISNGFKKGIKDCLKVMYDKHPYECFVVPKFIYNWLGLNFPNRENFLRSIEYFVSAHVLDELSSSHIRDWNDELQSVRGITANSEVEVIDKNRCIYKIFSEIEECSSRAAEYAVDSRLAPINDAEDERLKMFIWNNLFISFACESKDNFKELGGELASFIAPNLDVRAINYLLSHDVEDLYFLGTTVVDYRGFRLVIQTILPGIFNRSETDNVEYGSLDHGKTIFKDLRFEEVLKKVSNIMQSTPSHITDSLGQVHELLLSVEAKGVIGMDSRKYLIELYRFFPPDPLFVSQDLKNCNESILYFDNVKKICTEYNFKFPINYPHRLACFRPEYFEFLKRQSRMREEDNKAKELGDPEVDDLSKNYDSKAVIFTSFNPDCFESKIMKTDSSDISLSESRKTLRNVSLYYITDFIPVYINAAISGDLGYIFDHNSLTSSLHHKGINIRYIGYIASIVTSNPKAGFLLKVLRIEMICRAAKHIFRSALLRTAITNTSMMISHFLNCFLSYNTVYKIPSYTKIKIKKCNSIYKINWHKLTPISLWKYILDDIRELYGYNFNIESVEDLENIDIKCLSILKSFCQMVGVEILLKDYDFSSKKIPTFVPLDILNTFPIVKALSIPLPKIILNKLEETQILSTILAQVTCIKVIEELQYLISYFIQNYGGMIEENATAHATLARVYANMGDFTQATINQTKSVIILERINGIDHHLTIVSYFQLALYCKGMGNHVGAVNILHRVRYMINLAFGLKHPFVYEIERNLLALLFDLHDSKLTLIYAESIIKYISEFDPENLKGLAEIHQIMSAVLFNKSEFRMAFNHEKKAYQYLIQVHEANSPALKSCKNLLDLYLKTAISSEKVNQNKKTLQEVGVESVISKNS